jgi:hypothetical protein
MSRLRAVDGPPPEWEGAAAARALMERVIAQHPIGVMVVWECRGPDDRPEFDAEAVPPSAAMMRGLSTEAVSLVWPPQEDV